MNTSKEVSGNTGTVWAPCGLPRVSCLSGSLRGSTPLQRSFSSFPSGGPGVALLLQRSIVGVLVVLHAGSAVATHPISFGWCVALVEVVAGIALIIGLLTPIAGSLVCLGAIALLVKGALPAADVLMEWRIARGELTVMSAALIFLGPGAFSMDARLFGRRVVSIE